jgi:predicted outer membrane repeat protein
MLFKSLHFLRVLRAHLVTVARGTVGIALIAGLSFFLACAAQAATYTVTNCADTGAGTLRQAVDSANANPGADLINFALTCPTITLASTITIGETVNIIGPGASALTITSPSSRALTLLPLAAAPAFQEVSLSGLRFAGCTTSPSAPHGGAIRADRTNLIINATVFDGNDAPGFGGAIYFQSPGGASRTLDIAFTSFLNNGQSAVFGGGAILQDGTGAITIRRSLFRQNGAASVAAGGAIRSANADAVLIIESGFYGNVANSGGAISISGNGLSRIVASSFVENSARGVAVETDFGGGAIDMSLGALTVENSTFAANAIYGIGVGSAIAGRGNSLTLLNTTVAKNEARSSTPTNAGIAIFSAPAADNAVAALRLRNTVSSTNLGVELAQRHDVWIDGRGINSIFESTNSLVPILRNGTTVTQSPGGAILANAENNGGILAGEPSGAAPLRTMLIGAGSALINTGSNADAATLTTDQRGVGFPRIVDGRVDIGAVEYVASVASGAAIVPTMPRLALVLLVALLSATTFVIQRK